LTYYQITYSIAEAKKLKKKKEGNLILLAMVLTLTISQIVYSNILTFFPPYRTENHPNLSDTSIGFTIAYLIN
jgi:hypothetical protein